MLVHPDDGVVAPIKNAQPATGIETANVAGVQPPPRRALAVASGLRQQPFMTTSPRTHISKSSSAGSGLSSSSTMRNTTSVRT